MHVALERLALGKASCGSTLIVLRDSRWNPFIAAGVRMAPTIGVFDALCSRKPHNIYSAN